MTSGARRAERVKRTQIIEVDNVTRPFSGISPSRGPEQSYDAVVIGAGIGGLVCANILARGGLKVLLTEQHYMVGGYCSTFRRQGFVFDAASHFYPLLGNRESITGRLLQDLGLTTAWVKMDPVDQFHLPDGSDFSVSADYDTYLADLKRLFPGESESLDRFFRLVRRVYLLGLLHYFQECETNRLSGYLRMTVRDALNQFFTSEKLKLLLTADCPHWGSPPCRTSFVFDSMLRLSYFEGNYYPVGGSQVFADELASQFQRCGGQILTKSLVRRIVVRNQQVTGIEIETGPRRSRYLAKVQAGTVVSNADMRQTVFGMIGGESFPAEYVSDVRRLRPSFPCFLSHIGLQGISTDLLRRIHGYYWNGWDSDRVGTNEFQFKIFVPTLYEPRMAPAGGHVIVVQKVTDFDYSAVSDWKSHKQAIEAFVFKRLEELIPGFRDKIVVCQSASAQTSHRFTLNYHGAMLGWEMSPDQLGHHRPHLESPIAGLFFAGQWTRPGGGITPVIVSAKRVAERVIGNCGASSTAADPPASDPPASGRPEPGNRAAQLATSP